MIIEGIVTGGEVTKDTLRVTIDFPIHTIQWVTMGERWSVDIDRPAPKPKCDCLFVDGKHTKGCPMYLKPWSDRELGR